MSTLAELKRERARVVDEIENKRMAIQCLDTKLEMRVDEQRVLVHKRFQLDHSIKTLEGWQ